MCREATTQAPSDSCSDPRWTARATGVDLRATLVACAGNTPTVQSPSDGSQLKFGIPVALQRSSVPPGRPVTLPRDLYAVFD